MKCDVEIVKIMMEEYKRIIKEENVVEDKWNKVKV